MIKVVGSLAEAEQAAHELDEWSLAYGWPAAIDTEFYGVDPDKLSVVGRAKLWSFQIAYGPPPKRTPSNPTSLFVPAEYLPQFKPWLESHDCPKVGSDILTTERHVFKNHEVELNGIVGCTRLMSKMLDPSNFFRHGLKAWGERLGYEVVSFKSIASRPAHSKKVRAYKRDRQGWHADGWPLVYTAGAEFQDINWGSKPEMLSLPELWETYPCRRALIVAYAVQDPQMSLDAYWTLKHKLGALKW